MVNYRGSTGYGQKLADAIFKRSERRRGEGRAGRRGRGAREVSVDRSRAPRRRRRQLRRPAHELARHADAALQGGGARRRASRTSSAQLHVVLPRLSGGGVRRASRTQTAGSWTCCGSARRSAIAQGEDAGDVRRTARTTTTCTSPRPSSSTSRSRTSASRRVMVRYPREGHGMRESTHIVDSIDRSNRLVRPAFQDGLERDEVADTIRCQRQDRIDPRHAPRRQEARDQARRRQRRDARRRTRPCRAGST